MGNPNPVLKTYTIEYWDCGIEGHHHKTQEVAQECIDERSRPKTLSPSDPSYLVRNLEILLAVAAGSSVADIADTYGVTSANANRIIPQTMRIIALRGRRATDDYFGGLPMEYKWSIKSLRKYPEAWIRAAKIVLNEIAKGDVRRR